LHTKQWKSGNPISKHKDRSNLKKQKSKPRGTVAHYDLIGGDISRGMLAMIEAQVRLTTNDEVSLIAKAFETGIEELYS
jgi:isocitrate dehydrogenase